MPYSDIYQKKPIKIPSIFAVLMIAAVSFFVSNFFLSDPQSSKAVKKNVIDLEVSNISSSKANIVWRTSEKELGVLLYGSTRQKLQNLVTDERDSSNSRHKYFNHSVRLNNLLPNTEYFYSITNEKELLSINEKTVFNFKTAPINNRVNSLKPAYGIITASIGTPEPDVLVILKSENNIPLSTISKNSGEWLIPLNGLLNSNSLDLSTPALSSKVNILFYDEKGNSSSISAPIQLVSPISDSIKIGQNYNLPEESTVLGTSVGDTSSVESDENSNKSFKVSYPISDSIIPVGSPLIKGVAAPLSTVTITVLNTLDTIVFSKQTLADSLGEWKVTVSRPLDAGKYYLVARSSVPAVKSITREFTVTKSGERVLGEATGSATVTTTPTNIPTIEPTEITPTLPSTGGNISYLMYSSAALIILGLGLMFVF